MEFPRDPGPLLLLRVDEPASQLANLVVADAKLAFLCANADLGRAPPGSLHEKAHNEKRLKYDQRNRSDNVPAIELPYAWRAKTNFAVWRQPGFADPPSLQLPPVVGWNPKSK